MLRAGPFQESLRDVAALLRPAPAGLGPLGPAPAHPGHSLRDEVTFRFRGGIRRVAP